MHSDFSGASSSAGLTGVLLHVQSLEKTAESDQDSWSPLAERQGIGSCLCGAAGQHGHGTSATGWGPGKGTGEEQQFEHPQPVWMTCRDACRDLTAGGAAQPAGKNPGQEKRRGWAVWSTGSAPRWAGHHSEPSLVSDTGLRGLIPCPSQQEQHESEMLQEAHHSKSLRSSRAPGGRNRSCTVSEDGRHGSLVTPRRSHWHQGTGFLAQTPLHKGGNWGHPGQLKNSLLTFTTSWKPPPKQPENLKEKFCNIAEWLQTNAWSLSPNSTVCHLCDLGQVTQPAWFLVSSSVKLIKIITITEL
ncbi:uncharacterized protein [Equus asinus]|uniref:uncharacterized protein n=1 Tax=Equus asinus TaxID=9793 RepID=UPI001D037536|nr:uncharacterized protein LOC123280562 [Equus asinus]